VAVLTGCVTRSYTIETEPEGADVYVGGLHVGKSPVQKSFTYYGTRKVILAKKGYTTRTEEMKIPPPLYERFPLDFFSEVVWPQELKDERTLSYTLEPVALEAPADLGARAEAERKELAKVPKADFEPPPKRKQKQGHGTFPYPARDRSWWRQR
jgi:hypothetical protein